MRRHEVWLLIEGHAAVGVQRRTMRWQARRAPTTCTTSARSRCSGTLRRAALWTCALGPRSTQTPR